MSRTVSLSPICMNACMRTHWIQPRQEHYGVKKLRCQNLPAMHPWLCSPIHCCPSFWQVEPPNQHLKHTTTCMRACLGTHCIYCFLFDHACKKIMFEHVSAARSVSLSDLCFFISLSESSAHFLFLGFEERPPDQKRSHHRFHVWVAHSRAWRIRECMSCMHLHMRFYAAVPFVCEHVMHGHAQDDDQACPGRSTTCNSTCHSQQLYLSTASEALKLVHLQDHPWGLPEKAQAIQCLCWNKSLCWHASRTACALLSKKVRIFLAPLSAQRRSKCMLSCVPSHECQAQKAWMPGAMDWVYSLLGFFDLARNMP